VFKSKGTARKLRPIEHSAPRKRPPFPLMVRFRFASPLTYSCTNTHNILSDLHILDMKRSVTGRVHDGSPPSDLVALTPQFGY
jgi:hypothetical protein